MSRTWRSQRSQPTNKGTGAGSLSQVHVARVGTQTARGRSTIMETAVGIACGACNAWNPLATTECGSCGHDVSYLGTHKPARAEGRRSVVSTAPEARSGVDYVQALSPAQLSPAQLSPAQLSPAQLSKEELMEQARNYVCKEC